MTPFFTGGIGAAVGEASATVVGGIGTAVAGETVGNYLATAAFNGAMLGTGISLSKGAAAAATEFSSSSTSQTTQTQVASNLIASAALSLLSANNINVSASNLQTTGSGDVNLTSETGDVNVVAGINSTTTSNYSEDRKFSGVDLAHTNSSVGISFIQSGNEDTNTVTQTSLAQSIIASANNINITSGSLLNSSTTSGSTNILASTLSANNQINISANDQLNIKSQQSVTDFLSSHSDVTNTITLSVGNAWLALVEDSISSAKRISDSATSKTSDKAKAANVTAAGAQIGMDALQAIQTTPSFGFYAAITDSLSKTTTTTDANYVMNVASSVYATNDINLTSNSDLTVQGSNVYSESGNINLTSKFGDVNISAAQNTSNSSSSSKTNSVSETVSVSGGGIFISIPTISTSTASSNTNSTTYLSSNLSAGSGAININANQDTNVTGSSVVAKDVNITTNNLNVESLQSKLTSSSQSNSYSVGGTIGFNNSSSSQDRLWTDNVASIIGTNSVTINTQNNTNIIGGIIANITNASSTLDSNGSLTTSDGASFKDGSNLTLNTNTLTYSNLTNYNNSSNNSFGLSVALPVGIGSQTDSQGNALWDQPLEGKTNLAYSQIGINYANISSTQDGETKATIGQGTITLGTAITRDNTTGVVTSITGGETFTDNSSNSNQIANLNRDINGNQITGPTHYEGGYNISLNITPGILIDSYHQFQEGTLFQARDGSLLKLIEESGLIPTEKNNGGIYQQMVSMVTGDQSIISTELSDEAKYRVALANSRKENYDVITNENGETKIVFSSGESYQINLTKADIDDYSLGMKNQLKNGVSAGEFSLVNDLKINKDNSLNGINNTENEAIKNGLKQIGALQSNTLNVLYDPTHGPLPDLIEVGWNKLAGDTFLQSGNLYELNSYAQNVSQAASENNITGLRYVGHSGGGERLVDGVLLSGQNFSYSVSDPENLGHYLNLSRVAVQFFGTPVKTSDLGNAVEISGSSMSHIGSKELGNLNYSLGHQINPGDYVAENLGKNSSNTADKILGGFGPGIVNLPKLLDPTTSPHSSYFCEGNFCGYEKLGINVNNQ